MCDTMDAESLLASATDLANTYARMNGVKEAGSPDEIKEVIHRLAWEIASLRTERDALLHRINDAPVVENVNALIHGRYSMVKVNSEE